MRFLQLLLIVLLVPLAACATNGKTTTYAVTPPAAYALGPGDVVRVKVYGDETVSGSYRVDDSGAMSLPLVGPIRVAGQTTVQAAAAIAAALADGYMRSPDVAAEIESYRAFFIQGAVKSAGQFPYVPGLTLRAAIATAGGYTDTANRTRATIYRRSADGEMQKVNADLDLPVMPGDTIVVAERWL
jgi:polysaccharide export outer membrane protein